MKETLARIAAWAKANPVLAALILGAVILLGYLAYKSGQGSGTGNVTVPAPTDASALYGSGGGGGGGSTPPANPPPGKKKQKTPKPPAGGVRPNPTPLPVFDQGSGWMMGQLPGLSMTPGLDQQFSNFQLPISSLMMGQKSLAMTSGSSSASSRENYNSSPGAHVSRRGGGGGGGADTPAMAVGKGRHFTGYYNGTYYSNGYPAGSLSIPGVSQSGDYYYSDTGNRPAVASGKVRY